MKTPIKKTFLTKHQRPSKLIKFTFGFFLVIIFNFALVNDTFSQSVDVKLLELRNQFALNYLKPEAHFALAKYYLDKDDKLQAFLIMEYARRYRFEKKDFNAAFASYFGEDRNEPSGEAKAAFENAFDLLKQNRLDEAEKYFLTAANLAPKSSLIQTWVGRFFYKAKPNNEQALKYYYNAYFLDPHAYETEYVESRIRNISLADADIRFAELLKSGKSLSEISTDENPLIVSNTIGEMAKQWKNEYKKPLWEYMSNDDSLVRWFAFVAIFKNSGASADQFIAELQNDKDLRRQGLSAYGLIELQKEKSFSTLKKMLNDKAELIRFDALSALALKGGNNGLEILRTHLKVETNQSLKDLISKTLEKKQI